MTGRRMNGHGRELVGQVNHALDADDLVMGRQHFQQDLTEARPGDRRGQLDGEAVKGVIRRLATLRQGAWAIGVWPG